MGAVAAEGGSNKIKNTRSAKDSFGRIRETCLSRIGMNSSCIGSPLRSENKMKKGEKSSEGLQEPPHRARKDEQARDEADSPARHREEGHPGDCRDDGPVPHVRAHHLVPD